MKALLPILSLFPASIAQAHDALVPHTHPHATSMFPGVESIGVAVLVLAIAAFAFVTFRRGGGR